MKTLTDQLANYADYHRDNRNILTHFFGIPMIVLAVTVLLSRPTLNVADFAMTPALLVALATGLYYLKLDLRFGIVMGLYLGLNIWIAKQLAAQPTALWLTAGIGLFVIGWITQFVGHYYEQRKPAFVDDLIGLAIGPLFVMAEWGFMLGLRKDIEAAIEARVGPTLMREPRGQSMDGAKR